MIAPAAATFKDSAPGIMGIWIAGTPDHSFPRRPRVSLPSKMAAGPRKFVSQMDAPERGSVRSGEMLRSEQYARNSDGPTRSTTGMRKKAPALERMALGFLRDPVSGVVHTRETPAAEAVRSSVPRLPGSWIPQAHKTKGFDAAGISVRVNWGTRTRASAP